MDNLTPAQVNKLAVLVHAHFTLYDYLFEGVYLTLFQSKSDAELETICNALQDNIRFNLTGISGTMPDDVSLAVQAQAIAALETFFARVSQTRQTQTSPPARE